MSQISLNGAAAGTALMNILNCDDIEPGAEPSYQLCKTIFLYHPLGQKMAASPVKMAQAQGRRISVPDSPEDRVKRAFVNEWNALGCDDVIFNLGRTARIYGIASLALRAEGVPTDRPINYRELHTLKIALTVFDPLNTAGSLVLNQNPDAFDFQKVVAIRVQGKNYHPSRSCVLMHDDPVYIAYTSSAFGFTGRSVYQRALFPLKSFVQTMITDNLVTLKVGVLVAKQQQAGSIIDNVMVRLFGQKAQLLKQAVVGGVLSIGPNDEIESLNLQNLEGPHKLTRDNCLKNCATAGDMPAVILENETLTEGFGEGTEDAKNIAKYVQGMQKWLQPAYTFCDTIVQYRAWTPEFYKTIQADFEEYRDVSYVEALYRWRNSFAAEWPSLLEEPESEKIKVAETKFKTIISVLDSILPRLDPGNAAKLMEWAADNLNENKLLFTTPLELDWEMIASYQPPEPEKEAKGPMAFADAVGQLRCLSAVRE